MKYKYSLKPFVRTTILLLVCASSGQTALAEDEIRGGAVLQIPFSFSSLYSPVDFSGIRVGLTCQYAEVEEDTFISQNYIYDGEVIDSNTYKDGGNRVYGLEGTLFVEFFNDFDASAELLGLYGGNSVQGALGVGYDLNDEFFIDAKAMFPYSEVGMRIGGPFEVYGGVRTFGAFDPKNVVYPDVNIPLVAAPEGE